MAHPTIQSITTGISGAGVSSFAITMPSGLVKDELILIYISFYEAYYLSMSSTSGNFIKVASISDPYAERQHTIIYGRAIQGTSNNYITVNCSGSTYVKGYIVYRISGHGIYTTSDIDVDGHTIAYSSDITYQTEPLTASTTDDSLYIASIVYDDDVTLSGPTSFWSNLNTQLTNQNLSAQSIEYSGSIGAFAWHNSMYSYSQTYVTTTLRVKEGILGTASTGFGIYVPQNSIGLP